MRNEAGILKMQFPAPPVAYSPFCWELACLWCQMGHVCPAIVRSWRKPGWDATGDTLRIPPTCVHPCKGGCDYFSPSPHRDHGCEWYEEGKMEGVPDPGNPQLPPSLPGGTRGQRRLTQPTVGTGLWPAWPRDQRAWRWPRATFGPLLLAPLCNSLCLPWQIKPTLCSQLQIKIFFSLRIA